MAVALTCLSACATESIRAQKQYSPTTAKHVRIFGHAPKQPYEELGLVRDVEVFHSLGENGNLLAIGENLNILDVLREKAAALGADAVILKQEFVIDPQNAIYSDFSSHIWLTGMAIRFRAEQAVKPNPK
jgi:hypothetical protein